MSAIFIADLHLSPQHPELGAALVRFLQTQCSDCQQLYLLGDIFDAWIGDDFTPPGCEVIFDTLAELSAGGCQIYFQHGNRDFLVGQQLAERIGAQLLEESLVIELPAGQGLALILHGDQLCRDDTEYLALRQTLRSPAWQQQFLSQDIPARLAVAKQLRDASREAGQQKSLEITDVCQQEVRKVMMEAGVQRLIHGHTHRPAIHALELDGYPAERVVLGDWGKYLWFYRVDSSGAELIEQPLADYLD